jgi:hypothetical protein
VCVPVCAGCAGTCGGGGCGCGGEVMVVVESLDMVGDLLGVLVCLVFFFFFFFFLCGGVVFDRFCIGWIGGD